MSTIKLNEEFDFGFTSVDEGDINNEANSLADEYRDRLEKMHSMITPLINNLLADTDKAYIHWPNREEKLLKFQEQLDDLLNLD